MLFRSYLTAILIAENVFILLISIGLILLTVFLPESSANDSSPTSQSLNQFLRLLFTIGASISTGILGSKIANILQENEQRKEIQTKGKTAVRNLYVVTSTLSQLRSRLQQHLNDSDIKDNSGKLADAFFSYALDICNSIQIQIISCIEDWDDVLTTEQIIFPIAGLKQLRDLLASKQLQVIKLREELIDPKTVDEDEKRIIQGKISATEKEIDTIFQEIEETSTKVVFRPLQRFNHDDERFKDVFVKKDS